MSLFQRTIRLVLWLAGGVAAFLAAVAALAARRIAVPPRQPLWADPEDLGMPYETVQFPAREDGVRLSGWFLPSEQSHGRTIVVVHGWPWNRLGEIAEGLVPNLIGSRSVDLLRLAHSLHGAGFNVLMYDARNHGESASHGTVTFGFEEANDLLGALDFLSTRSEVDDTRIGVVGFSMGANATMYALPRTHQVKAVVAVQPMSVGLYSTRFSTDVAGPLGKPLSALTELMVQQMGGMRFAAIDPLFIAPAAGETPVLFIQGSHDPWGSADNVAQIAAATPNAVDTIYVDGHGRYEAYEYVVDHPELLTSYFGEYL